MLKVPSKELQASCSRALLRCDCIRKASAEDKRHLRTVRRQSTGYQIGRIGLAIIYCVR